MIYRDVLHDKMGAEAGTDALRKILRSPPIYPLRLRCFFAFLCAAIICGLSFGGSFVDIWIAGLCASALQYLGLNAANKSTMYANVYEYATAFYSFDCTNDRLVLGSPFQSLSLLSPEA